MILVGLLDMTAAFVSTVCRAGYYQLRQLRLVVQSLSGEAAKTLVQVFTSSSLDFCNTLLYLINDSVLHCLQLVHNATACPVIGVREHGPVYPVLR